MQRVKHIIEEMIPKSRVYQLAQAMVQVERAQEVADQARLELDNPSRPQHEKYRDSELAEQQLDYYLDKLIAKRRLPMQKT